MKRLAILREEDGQDLVEYTLLLAMITIAGAALFMGQDESIHKMWNAATANLKAAAGG
jgi:Flp pilus assembly pilin Flp